SAGSAVGNSNPDQQPSEGGPNSDIIREGKEKAKQVMAASGMDLGSSSAQPSPSVRTKTPPAAANAANGISPSRKRSRSGSRMPSQPPSHESTSHDQPDVTEYLINQYATRDMLHAAAMNDQAQSVRLLMEEKHNEVKYYRDLRDKRQADPGSVFGYGFAGYGNGTTDSRAPRLQYPAMRKRPGHRRSKSLHVARKDMPKQADQLEELVPVRLDIEFDKIKLRDTFTWNLHDRVVTPELFAENLVEDFRLPPEVSLHVSRQVNHEIHEQIGDFYPHVFIREDPLDPHLPYSAYKNDEMRVLIKLNITIGPHTLVDQFEWDINDPMNSPEEFARRMTWELALSGEFTTAIAHSIREQCQMFTKSLYITGHPFDGRTVEDADVRDSFLQSPLPNVFRPAQAAKEYAPVLYELNEADLERAELSILREQRRQKRSVNRRGGPALPDLKDRQRTVRTMVVSSVLPGAVERVEDSRLYKVTRSASGKRNRQTGGRADGGDDSDDSESEDTGPDSPAPSQILGGTARTRGIRGAAAAATNAMRANLGRSATPEVSALQREHHHETRTSARRGGFEAREESVAESTSLLLKLRIPRAKYRLWAQAQQQGRAHEYRQAQLPPPGLMASQASTPVHNSTPARTSMPPPPSPAMQQRSTPTAGEWRYYPDGRADAPYPPPANHRPPPPPAWLTNAISTLLTTKYPNESFEAHMRHSAVDKTTNQPVRLDLPPNASPPPNIKFQYLPRIRCNDCPGKLYTAGPGLSIENFEVHLRNRLHREAVQRRRGSA
ncbi:SNF5-domain-containing protein, partial [Saccharata proteae CBS 121410]